MTVRNGYWAKYLELLGSINQSARTQFLNYFVSVDYQSPAGRQAVIDFAFALVTKYGEASAEAACQLYDAIAEATGVSVPPAVPAATATIGETAKAINGTIAASTNADYISGTVERLVKQASADTIYQNAIRDGAECAWIPVGDTCAFCIMLASNGWKKASKRTLKGNHASHVHSNCDCNFAVRFASDTQYDGYDPNIYLERYDSAEGDTWHDKLNSMRREQYQLNGDEIRKQKRIAYAVRNQNQV